MSSFKDAVAIVTGGTSGIGRELCEELGRRGSRVVVTGRNLESAEAVASRIVAAGGRAEAVRVDVSSEEEVRQVVDDVAASHGRLDYMFNNAGFAMRCEMQNMTVEHWHRIVDVNLMGVVYGASAAYARMVRQGTGHIVNMSSLAGLTGFPTATAYSTAKAATVALSVSLRAEGAEFGVKVSVVCPGYVASRNFRVSDEGKGGDRGGGRMRVKQAVRDILAGVEKNRMVILFPFKARLKWWLNRLSPVFLQPNGRRLARTFRNRKPARGSGELFRVAAPSSEPVTGKKGRPAMTPEKTAGTY